MSYNICSIRVIGDLAFVLSFPVLIGRIWKRGNTGISATTQGLHLLVFLLRYSDLNLQELGYALSPELSWASRLRVAWTPWLKVYLIIASAAVLVAMRMRKNKNAQLKCTRDSLRRNLREYALYILPAFFIAYRFNYTSFSWMRPYGSMDVVETYHTFGWVASIMKYFSLGDLFNINGRDAAELAWAISIFLAAFADIPQYVTYYHSIKDGMDWWLMSAMAMFAACRMFYLIHWVDRFIHIQLFDPISFIGGVMQVFAFWMLLVVSISKANDCIGDNDFDLEAQMADYDAAQWGETLPEDDQHEK